MTTQIRVARYAAVSALLALVVAPIVTASAANAVGVGDITTAVRYGNDGRVIGEIAADIQESDDDSQLIQAPWPMNFFGRKYDGICVTSNGTVSPVHYDTASCDDSYDHTLDSLASSADAPVIAAFANDNDLGNSVRNAENTITEMTVTGDPTTSDSVVTVTTSNAHGLTTGDYRSIYMIDSAFDNGNTRDNRTDEYWFKDVQITVIDSTHFSFSGDTAYTSGGSSITPTYPSALKSGTIAVDQGWEYDQNSQDQNGIDDGVGVVNTVYIGTTTVDGRDAWVYTDYRSVTYEDDNPQILTNTFQIVLVKKATVNGDTNGFDFDIEYNYGSMRDGGDGYNCSGSMTSTCRTGVGLVDWDPIGEVADVYELFPNTPGRDLVDGHATAMTNNSLNSDIKGRYTFEMVGGAVQGFAIPNMDGSGTTESRPEPEDPLAPVPGDQRGNPGDHRLVVNGTNTSISVVPNDSTTGIIGTSGDLVFNLAGLDSTSTPLNLDSDGNLVLDADGLLDTSGEGFAADSPVKVYIYSEPTFLGKLFTDSTGQFTGTLQIPAGLHSGVHNIQVTGYDTNGNVLVFTVGVVVAGGIGGTDGHGGNSLLAATGATGVVGTAALGVLLVAAGVVFIQRRRARSN
jgi:LPXTG-motif cell wall-anchored protein